VPVGSRPAKAAAGLFVLVPAWLSLVLLFENGSARGRVLLLVLLVLIWLADIAAYFCGRRWGRVKLAPRISPGKTRVGAYAAIISSGLYGLAGAGLMGMQAYEMFIFTCICMLTVVASIMGDLLESLMKRGVKLKDSGHLLPGHGGVLDRIDSMTAAAPVFAAGIWLLELAA
jgi:phosphatidate cytidylyltransferase